MADRREGTPHIHSRAPGDPEISAAVQDYAKAIYAIERQSGEAAGTNALAERLGVSAASASAMLKKLDRLGLIEHEPYRGVRLTQTGRQVALEVIRHHRLLETFLAQELGMPWDRVHAEAEVLEHAISEELEAILAARLGDPSHDPHGDPIPTATLEIDEGDTVPLDSLGPGACGTFTRVSDQDPAMLRYLAEQGIRPGDPLEVVERQPFGGPLLVRFDGGQPLAIGGGLALAMHVERSA